MEWSQFFTSIKLACNGQYHPQGSVDVADCVFAFAMGYGKHDGLLTPGQGNIDLARYIYNSCAQLPVFAQAEIAAALIELNYEGPVYSIGEIGQKTTTHEVFDRQSMQMWKLGLRHPLVVASSYHVCRVVAIMKRSGMHPIVPQHLPDALDPASVQWRTRYQFLWTAWEFCAWPHHQYHGWI